jgi:hypothetical protein
MRLSSNTDARPDDVFREAVKDIRAAHHESALEKLVWFHYNAIRLRPSLSGVRRSFALRAWKNLAERYPPAMKALRARRDAARNASCRSKGKDAVEEYADFAAINHYLEEDSKTVRLFKWLHKHRPDLAKDVYNRTEAMLYRAGEFTLCCAYINGKEQFDRIRRQFRINMRLARDREIGVPHQQYAREAFSEKATRLVALLVLNERTKEAKQVVVRAKRVWSDETFSQQLESALKSQIV